MHAQEPMHMLPCKRLEKSRVVVRLRSLFERMRAIQLGLKAFALEGRGYRCRWLGSSNPNPGTAPTFHEYAPTQKRTGNVILTAAFRVLTSYSIIWGHVLPMAVFRGRAIVANSGMHGASENGMVETSGKGSVSVFGDDSTFNGNPGWRQGSIPTWKPSDYGTKTQGRRGAKYPLHKIVHGCWGWPRCTSILRVAARSAWGGILWNQTSRSQPSGSTSMFLHHDSRASIVAPSTPYFLFLWFVPVRAGLSRSCRAGLIAYESTLVRSV